MKYAIIFDPASCDRKTIYFDFSDEIENATITWMCTDGYTSADIPERMDSEHFNRLNEIGTGKSKSYWLPRCGGDYDALSDIHEANETVIRQFRNDFKNVCGFFPKFRK